MIRDEQFNDTPTKEYTPDPIDEYVVIVNLPEDWDEVHNYIINENEIDGIPNRRLDCINDHSFSLRTSVYMMSAEEAELLKTHPKVENVGLNPSKYPQPGSLDAEPRWGKDVAFPKIPFPSADQYNNDYDISYTNGVRSNWSHLFANNQSSKPYQGVGITTAVTTDRDINYSVTGKNVDAIIFDTGIVIMHPEFFKPEDYAKGYSSRVKDLYLEGPATIDPDAFVGFMEEQWLPFQMKDGNALSIGVRPQQERAIKWWSDPTIRSAAFQSLGVIDEISFKIGVFEGRTWYYDYPMAFSTAGTLIAPGNTLQGIWSGHGTACASQIGGKSYGLAFDCNIWNARIMLSNRTMIDPSVGLNMAAIFHQGKKIASTDPNPTVLSNSWSSTGTIPNSTGTVVNFNYRGTSGSYTGTGTPYTTPTNGAHVQRNMNYSFFDSRTHNQGYQSSYGGGKFQVPETQSVSAANANSAVENAIAVGCIVLCSAGNTNAKLCDKDDPDFDNWALASYWKINRTTGVTRGFSGDHYRDKGSIRVGALDTAVEPYDLGMTGGINRQGVKGYLIRKVCYSACGPMITIWAPGESTLAAYHLEANYPADTQRLARIMARNDDFMNPAGTHTYQFYDMWFGGTSAATPITASLVTLFLEGERGATQSDTKNWLDSSGSVEIELSDPYPEGAQTSQLESEDYKNYWSRDFRGSIEGIDYLHPYHSYNIGGSGNLRGATKRVINNPFALGSIADPVPDPEDIENSQFTLKGTSFTVTGDDLTIKLS